MAQLLCSCHVNVTLKCLLFIDRCNHRGLAASYSVMAELDLDNVVRFVYNGVNDEIPRNASHISIHTNPSESFLRVRFMVIQTLLNWFVTLV